MNRGALPPYFTPVCVAVAIVLALTSVTAAMLPHAGEIDLGAMQKEIAPAVPEATDDETEPEPATPHYTLPLQGTKFPVIVGGTSFTEARVRRNLHGFKQAVLDIEQAGYEVGVVIRDMGTGAYLAYAPDRDLYCASCIKAPYVVSIYERLVDTGQVSADAVSELAGPTIIASDNDAYRALSEQYGRQVFVDWAADCTAFKRGGVRYQQLIAYRYSLLRPRQLARMWQHTYTYLNGGSEGARQLLDFFERREVSPIRDGLPEATRTIAKAGWYPTDDGVLYAATNDAGIVEMGGHTYVVVFMTNIPDDLGRLTQHVHGLFSAVGALG